jgi:hypothetical protein
MGWGLRKGFKGVGLLSFIFLWDTTINPLPCLFFLSLPLCEYIYDEKYQKYQWLDLGFQPLEL